MKFSIITPSLNQSAYLPECVESVRGQVLGKAEKLKTETLKKEECGYVPVSTFQHFSVSEFSVEHLIQDGGSVDGTVEWLLEKAEKLKGEEGEETPISACQRVSISDFAERYAFSFVSGADKGQTDAINKGLARATGDILSYLCADDYLLPGALARVAEIFDAHPEVDVVYGDYAFLEGDSGWVRRKRVGPFSEERLRRDNFISQPATFWRRRVYERFGGFDESLRFCMDHEYWLRIAGSTSWFYLPEMLAVQRLHGDSKTGSQLVEAWEETALMAGRYGLGEAFERKAGAMRLYGAAYYALRRRLFRCIGRWMR